MSSQLTVGSRIQVWHGTAKKTSGGLTKGDLKYNQKTGRIVSVKASRRAMSASNPLRQRGLLGAIGLLEAGGYVASPGGVRRTPLPGQGKNPKVRKSMASKMAKKARMAKKHASPKKHKSHKSPKKHMSPMAALRRSMRHMMA
jgi:hypothetical protein